MRLSFQHPTTDKNLVFMAPPPDTGAWTRFRTELGTLETLWPEIV